jgi:3-oxoadipate enol-lactonase
MPYAALNGIRIHYDTHGEGDPVLLISGLSAPSANWLFQVKGLAPHYRVITFDNRGAGESDLPEAPVYPTAQMADDAAAVLEHLDIKRAHVVGHSMGGTIAMELAIRHPRRVRSLSLCGTWAQGDGRFLHAIRAWMALWGQLDPDARFRYLVMPWLYTPTFLDDPAQVDETVKRVLSFPFPTRPEAVQRQGQGILDWNGTRLREIRKIRVPTLVLAGRDDNLTVPAFSRSLAAMIPKATLKVIPGGHGFAIERWEEFNRAVLGFLRGVKR